MVSTYFVQVVSGYMVNTYYTRIAKVNTYFACVVTWLAHILLNLFQGAGHFVPTDKPWPAYIMWETFLNDTHY